VGCHKKNKQGTNNGTPKLTDPEIASVAVAANQIDINHAKIALKKSKNINVRMFATNMITDHKAIINAASALVKKLGVTPKNNKVTKSLKKNAKKVTKMLKSKNGKAFNKAYINNEIKYHSAVISDVKNVLVPQAKNKQLKDLLIRAEPVFKEHLHHAKNVQNELSSSGSGNNSNSNNKAGGSSY
jgi:putative membrane protein